MTPLASRLRSFADDGSNADLQAVRGLSHLLWAIVTVRCAAQGRRMRALSSASCMFPAAVLTLRCLLAAATRPSCASFHIKWQIWNPH